MEPVERCQRLANLHIYVTRRKEQSKQARLAHHTANFVDHCQCTSATHKKSGLRIDKSSPSRHGLPSTTSESIHRHNPSITANAMLTEVCLHIDKSNQSRHGLPSTPPQ